MEDKQCTPVPSLSESNISYGMHGRTSGTAETISATKFHENPFSRSRERLSHIFGGLKSRKKTKKNKLKNICKTYTLPPHRRLRK